MDFSSLRKIFKKEEKKERKEPIRLSFAFAIAQAIDLAEEQPLSHGIKLTFLTLSAAERLLLPEEEILSTFYTSIFHDAGMIPLKKEIYFMDQTHKIYSYLNIHKEEGFANFRHFLEAILDSEKRKKWTLIQKKIAEFIATLLNVYGLSPPIKEKVLTSFKKRYYTSPESSVAMEIVTVGEKILHILNDTKKNREKAVGWLEEQYKNYDFDIINTFHKLISNENFVEFIFEGDIEKDIRNLKPYETIDSYLDPDDVKNIFALFEETWVDFGHTSRVEKILKDFSKFIYLSPEETEILTLAAGVHDLGKLHVQPHIIYKNSGLNHIEIKTVQRHPYYSEMILEKIPGLEDIASVAGKHHEYLDCSGYWRGICGNEIDFFTRLFTIVDIYEALTSKRPYRKAFSPKKAITIMEKEYKERIDSEILRQFKKMVL